MTKGQCLCGHVEFAINGDVPDFYQCHCSLCRKLSGSASDTATFLNKAQFSWIRGEESVRSYKTDSGYRSDFCSNCGSTVPHLMENGEQYWIPAGLLDDSTGSQVVAHLFAKSKAHWDELCGSGVKFDEMPDLHSLNKQLQRDSD